MPSSQRKSPTMTGYSPAGSGTGMTLGAGAALTSGVLGAVVAGAGAFLLLALRAGAAFLAGASLAGAAAAFLAGAFLAAGAAGAAVAMALVSRAKGRASRSFFMAVLGWKESIQGLIIARSSLWRATAWLVWQKLSGLVHKLGNKLHDSASLACFWHVFAAGWRSCVLWLANCAGSRAGQCCMGFVRLCFAELVFGGLAHDGVALDGVATA